MQFFSYWISKDQKAKVIYSLGGGRVVEKLGTENWGWVKEPRAGGWRREGDQHGRPGVGGERAPGGWGWQNCCSLILLMGV